MPGCSGDFKVQPAASELALPSMSGIESHQGGTDGLWLHHPTNCGRWGCPQTAVTITQGTTDTERRLNSPTQTILPAPAAAMAPGEMLGRPWASQFLHFSFFLSGKSCRRLPGLRAPQHPRGGRSGRLPYVSEGGTLQNSLCSEADLIKSQFYGACANYNF